MRRRQLLPWLLAPLLLGAGVVAASRLWVEWHWFEQFGWGRVLLRRLGLQLALALAGLALGFALQRGLEGFWRLGQGGRTLRHFPLEPVHYAVCLLLLACAQLLPLLLLMAWCSCSWTARSPAGWGWEVPWCWRLWPCSGARWRLLEPWPLPVPRPPPW